MIQCCGGEKMKNGLKVGGLMKYILPISVATLITSGPVLGEDFNNSVPVNLLLNNEYNLSATLHEVRAVEAIGAPAQIHSARVFMLDEAGMNRVYGEVQVAGDRELTDCVYHPSTPSAIIEFDFDSESILSAEVVVATIDSFGGFGSFQRLVVEGQLGAPLLGTFSWGIGVPRGFRVRGGVYITVTSIITSDGEIWEGNPINILRPNNEVIPDRGVISGNPYSKPRFCDYTIAGENDQQLSSEYSGDIFIELDRLVDRFGAQNLRDALERY
ncbi:hypothetical protein GCU56_22820 [Geodermatophilus sabuli]|uniref:Uncharacterized protein n=3 Tax=Bacteria TaxID=2 RepID=A0A7K3W913_9ACTN|nr:hypothetical protein [Geodermatophilus sabuli]NEK60694.1 hypothetical protein [Geodermatophilus sabuli]